MDVRRQVEYWRSGSREDFAAALALASQHLRHAMFLAHLSLEKLLEALVTQATAAVPPRMHDPLRLAEQAGVRLDPGRRESLASFQKYAIEGRYPDSQSVPLSRPEVAEGLRTGQELLTWLQSQFS